MPGDNETRNKTDKGCAKSFAQVFKILIEFSSTSVHFPQLSSIFTFFIYTEQQKRYKIDISLVDLLVVNVS